MMQTQYALLKQENFQLKNQICELKNAFDLNRDILKIVTEQVKSQNPRVNMLYQIINRLTNINNQVMIDTAELIHQKNTYKIQKQYLKNENQLLIDKIKEYQKQQIIQRSTKISELSLYFNNKIHDLENQIKAFEEDRIIHQHEIQYLKKKLEFYGEQDKKRSIIPTIDKKNSQTKLVNETSSPLIEPFKHTKKHLSKKQTLYELKNRRLQKQINRMKIYNEQIEYRLNIFMKMYQIENQLKKKNNQTVKKQHRKCLEDKYQKQLIQVRLLKFAINNLSREEIEGSQYLFTVTNRNNLTKIHNYWEDKPMSSKYLHRSVEKYDRVKMRPSKKILEACESQYSQNQQEK